jgi:hypothetical protein
MNKKKRRSLDEKYRIGTLLRETLVMVYIYIRVRRADTSVCPPASGMNRKYD